MSRPLPFENMNETDVREVIIAPLIEKLGYQTGGENSVLREQSLRYPRQFLGRKNQRKDPELRGKADYILTAQDRITWVIEAKAPEVQISIDDIEQAWTYANHPEVRAVYFVVCNGRMLSVYQTNSGANAPPTLSLRYEDFDDKFHVIENLLGPVALIREYPEMRPDLGKPIAEGLRSIASIPSGVIQYNSNNLNIRTLSELRIAVTDGAIERDEGSSGLIIYLKTSVPFRSLQDLNERLGMSEFEMQSTDSVLSTNPDQPTVFTYNKSIILPAGEKLLDITTWNEVTLPLNIICHVKVSANGYYSNGLLSGEFENVMQYSHAPISIKTVGSFQFRIS